MSTTTKRTRPSAWSFPSWTPRSPPPPRRATVSTSTESAPKTPATSGPRTRAPCWASTWPARTSADQDAPNQRVPFVTNGVLRVHPSDWLSYL